MSNSQGNVIARFLPFLGKKGLGDDHVHNEQQQQLMLLFEKRNELKREFGRTLDELEATTAERDELRAMVERDSARLRGLEELLSDPGNCQNAIVYYRLDTLWKSCRQQLVRRRQELEKKFEELERAKMLEDFKAHAVQQQKQLEEKFKRVDAAYQEKAGELAQLQGQLARSQKPWHFFRRKRLAAAVLDAEESMAPAISQREECLAELERVRDREPPAWPGLSVRSRREINLHLIALAQYLVVHFSENDLATLARSTQLKAPGEWRYGNNEECVTLLRPIRDIVAKLKTDERRQERLQRRVNHLRETLSWEGNADTVPDPKSVSRIEPSPGPTQSFEAVMLEIPVNVIEQDFWGIAGELLAPPEKKGAEQAPIGGIAAD